MCKVLNIHSLETVSCLFLVRWQIEAQDKYQPMYSLISSSASRSTVHSKQCICLTSAVNKGIARNTHIYAGCADTKQGTYSNARMGLICVYHHDDF